MVKSHWVSFFFIFLFFESCSLTQTLCPQTPPSFNAVWAHPQGAGLLFLTLSQKLLSSTSFCLHCKSFTVFHCDPFILRHTQTERERVVGVGVGGRGWRMQLSIMGLDTCVGAVLQRWAGGLSVSCVLQMVVLSNCTIHNIHGERKGVSPSGRLCLDHKRWLRTNSSELHWPTGQF